MTSGYLAQVASTFLCDSVAKLVLLPCDQIGKDHMSVTDENMN